jgi:hypothetical protein
MAGAVRVVFSVACIIAATVNARAQDGPASVPQGEAGGDGRGPAFRYEIDNHITVSRDGRSRQRQTVKVSIAKEAVLARIGQQSVSYVENMETLDVIEAYTQKPDGNRVPIDPAAILTRDAASGLDAVYLRDAKTKTLIFRDVAVGDTLVYTLQRDVKQTAFEGHFSYSALFQRSQPWSRATVVLDVPKAMALRLVKSGEEVTHSVAEAGDRVVHTLRYQGKDEVVREEKRAVSALDRDPRFDVSSFGSLEEFGKAFWRDAAPKIEVTADIQKLAQDIVRGIDSKRGEADAIDRWMKRNVRYVAVYLGRQRWVPNTASAVLANKYGDCKDMVTLMSALLAARGIAFEQVLINLGTTYAAPDVAPGPFNHVILYLPAFGVYTDPTATFSAFGVLSQFAFDKPVIHASESGARLARTPAMKASEHETIAQTKVVVAADGTVSGKTVQKATGVFATSARVFYLRAQAEGYEQSAERMLAALRTPGKGKFEASSPSEIKEPYIVTATFSLNDKLALPLRGARRMPFGLPVLARPGQFLLADREPDRKQNFICFGGRQSEDIDIEFASELVMPRRPNGRTIETPQFTYKVSYAIDGRVLKVRRSFTSLVAGQVCDPRLESEVAQPLKSVSESVFSPLVFGSIGDNGPGDYSRVPVPKDANRKGKP